MASSYRKELRRISLDVQKDIHKEVVMAACERNISIKMWCLRLIVRELKRKKKDEEQC
jgi:hypothetical protein